MDATSTLVFFVNGKRVIEPQPDPEWTLLYYLRNKLRLCGTKLGCAEGGCGACTVMVSRYDEPKNQVRHFAVNACLAPVCSMHGLAVTTVEGIGSTRTKLHPVQERIAKAHGSQCGFCTPGFVMSMYSLLRQMPKPKMKDLEIAFQGNLCRCTGYRPIIDGYKTFTEEFRGETNGTNGHDTWISNGFGSNGCGMGDKCCKLRNGVEKNEEVLFDPSDFIPYDPTQEPIFPPELKISNTYNKESLMFKSKNVTWYRPKNLREILELKAKYPEAKIVVGNTEVGVEMKFKNCLYPVLIYPTLIEEMIQITTTQDGVRVGASVTLDDLGNYLQIIINNEKPYKTRIFKAITDMLHFFAGKQVRNVAAIGGNIMTGSPISDLNPILLASKVKLELISEKNGTRYVLLDENFFTGYRRNVVKNDEILVSITIPYTTMHQYFWAHKQARRRDDDIAIVNHAMNVTFETDRQVIETIYLAYGGLAPITASPKNTQKKLIGLPWNQETLELAFECLLEDLPLQPSAPGGMIKYRRTLMLSLFFKGFLYVSQQRKEPLYKLDERTVSATENFHSKLPKSSQYFEMRPTKEVTHMLGRPMVHQSAYKQATGEAVYCDDLPSFENEVYMAFVYSQKSHAKILNIDPSEALKMEGVHAYVSKNDIPAMTKIGSVIHDEEIFFNEIVTSQMQIIAAVVADNQVTAQRAAKKVKVSYEDLQPVVVTIEDAIKYDSYLLKEPKKLENGDVDAAFKDSPNIIEGECRMGGQEHFYLETQCVICVPKKEDYEMEIYSSTQHPSEISDLVAKVLNIPQNRIITKVKRLGGGFGGKESKAALVAVPAAVAAFKLNRPVRIMLDRDEDIALTGGRHPFLFKYKVGFDSEGKILCLEVKIYQNCGYSYDLSLGVLERAIFHIDNAFRIPVIRVFGYACKTNLPSNTAFRGFGGPQGMFAIETIVRQIADYLQKDVLDVTERNLYKEGDLTHYNQKLEHCTLKRCWDECLIKSDYHERKKATEKFNSNNRYKKRGLSVVPTKFGIAFTVPHLNQGGALLLVYKDGSVLLSHGGTEMGQGLHTKMLQVASKALDIPVSKIHISETATDKVPNTSPTAASAGSDINGMAVLEACEKINNRLKPFKEKNPKGTWEDWVNQAYYDRVSLAATGFYKTPFIGFNWETLSGDPFSYFTFGVAATEVEIDCLTGDHQVLRTDIVMDLGESLNPAIDIGQIEGAFVQGYGLFILEELMYAPNGTLFTRGPGAYKLPSLTDIPIEFNVSLLKGAPNPRAVYSSKAVGEPPLFLASSVLFALREAIKDARKDAGVNPSFILNAPATSANIRINCEDHLTAKVPLPEPESFVPWNVTV